MYAAICRYLAGDNIREVTGEYRIRAKYEREIITTQGRETW